MASDGDTLPPLLRHGVSLLLLDVPPHTLLGLDLHMSSVGPLFKGFKMIPPGPHFLSYSSHSSAFVSGFFLHPSPSDVIVRQWDPLAEQLLPLSDSDTEERYRIAVRNLEFDRNLAAYDLRQYPSWKRLTSYLTPATIERFEPVGAEISVIAETEFAEKLPKTPVERRLHEHLTQSREILGKEAGSSTSTPVSAKENSGRCFYRKLPHLIRCPGSTAAELTALNVDKSAALESLLNSQYGGSEDLLLGELQFSFIAFLMGQSLESFSQWKSIVCLMLSCEQAPLRKQTRLFVKFLDVLCSQLETGLKTGSTNSDSPFLDETWFFQDNFLRLLFKEFYQMVMDTRPVDGDLLKHTRRLKSILELSLGWNFDIVEEEPGCHDEYAPVVVMDSELTYQHGTT